MLIDKAKEALLMSLDERKWMEYDDKYPNVRLCTIQSKSMKDSLACYEFLYRLKSEIPKELYAFNFRRLLQMNTGNVSVELRLKMFEGVNPEDIMFQDELDTIENEFEDYITVYRGATKDENIPGISWTIYRQVAEDTFYRGRLFEAQIPKSSILLYLAHEEDEGEIIAHVTSGYRIIKED